MQLSSDSGGALDGSTSAGNTWESLGPYAVNTVNVGAVIQTNGVSGGPASVVINGGSCSIYAY